jgi:hypothetical protein
MPALRCPRCGYSDLHAVDVELVHPDLFSESGFRRTHRQELGCKRCDWSPSKAAEPAKVLVTTPINNHR